MLSLALICLAVAPQVISEDSNGLEHRIIGGQEADIKDYPYQVVIQVSKTYDVPRCGGAIISKDYILTTFQCIQLLDPSIMVVKAGSSYRKNGTIIPIAKLKGDPYYDIAYMKTAEPIQFNNTVQPIELPPRDRSMEGNATLTGWGQIKNGDKTYPDRLRKVDIEVIDHKICIEDFRDVDENIWCGGDYDEGDKGACKGDAGGPAVQDGMLVGIASNSKVCEDAFAVNFFVDIAAPDIRDYIKKNTDL